MEAMPKSPWRFGDEHSSLFDQFERLTFEITLNQAMLGRSFSANVCRPYGPPATPMASHQRHRQCYSRLSKVLKKVLKPLLSRKGRPADAVPNDHIYCKRFSRSVQSLNIGGL
ncbi:hypothetical protein IFM89_003505 [Coptis chinensis]|uniref:Uncharacterized protein n=1 Tax=Coptis chinensis TaxID=261450 RepID=A0A835LHI3_9MAGN|nr:hypothetical protein IFM89_003505 [Coptis chinensis]